jgi:hypothetical protein
VQESRLQQLCPRQATWSLKDHTRRLKINILRVWSEYQPIGGNSSKSTKERTRIQSDSSRRVWSSLCLLTIRTGVNRLVRVKKLFKWYLTRCNFWWRKVILQGVFNCLLLSKRKSTRHSFEEARERHILFVLVSLSIRTSTWSRFDYVVKPEPSQRDWHGRFRKSSVSLHILKPWTFDL